MTTKIVRRGPVPKGSRMSHKAAKDRAARLSPGDWFEWKPAPIQPHAIVRNWNVTRKLGLRVTTSGGKVYLTRPKK